MHQGAEGICKSLPQHEGMQHCKRARVGFSLSSPGALCGQIILWSGRDVKIHGCHGLPFVSQVLQQEGGFLQRVRCPNNKRNGATRLSFSPVGEPFELSHESVEACVGTSHAVLEEPQNTQVHGVLLCPLLDEPSPSAALAAKMVGIHPAVIQQGGR